MKKVFEILSLVGLGVIFVLSLVIPSNPFEVWKGINYDYPLFMVYLVGGGALYLMVLWVIYSLLDLIMSKFSKPVISESVIKVNDSKPIEEEEEEEEEEEVFEREDLGSVISYFELLQHIDEGTQPLEVELMICKKRCRYVWDDENEYYIIKSREEEHEPFEYWLRDCLVDSQSFEKCIKIKR